MLNSISGTLTHKGKDCAHVSTQGVEWEILTSTSSLDDLPEVGAPVQMWVYLYHREITMQLYGFAGTEERSVFLELLKVDGMGPRLALRVLSGMRPQELLRAVRDRDTATLSRVPGIGPKTAEKLVITLTGKPILESAADGATGGGAGGGGSPIKRDLTTALAAMGFDRREAQRAVEAAVERLAAKGLSRDDLEKEALRDALRALGETGR